MWSNSNQQNVGGMYKPIRLTVERKRKLSNRAKSVLSKLSSKKLMLHAMHGYDVLALHKYVASKQDIQLYFSTNSDSDSIRLDSRAWIKRDIQKSIKHNGAILVIASELKFKTRWSKKIDNVKSCTYNVIREVLRGDHIYEYQNAKMHAEFDTKAVRKRGRSGGTVIKPIVMLSQPLITPINWDTFMDTHKTAVNVMFNTFRKDNLRSAITGTLLEKHEGKETSEHAITDVIEPVRRPSPPRRTLTTLQRENAELGIISVNSRTDNNNKLVINDYGISDDDDDEYFDKKESSSSSSDAW
jgi:hypothetical protein